MIPKVRRNDPCPCGKALKAKRCCLQSNGVLRKSPAMIVPQGFITGFSHPKCFAKVDCNCSHTISREHFISEVLLKQVELSDTVKIAGLKWQPPKEFGVFSISSLAPKILCDRHNNALSPLDDVMGKFSQTLQDYDDMTHPSVNFPKSDIKLFAGEDIEKWMLKCLLGGVLSNNFSQGNLKPECLEILYGRIPWPDYWGLYLDVNPTTTVYHSDSFGIETKMGEDKIIRLAHFAIRGLSFYLSMGKPSDPNTLGFWRPSQIVFEDRGIQKVIEFSWDVPNSGYVVKLERNGVYDGLPPNWEDWQKN